MKKRILSILLALAMTVSMLSNISPAAMATENPPLSTGSGTLEDPTTTVTTDTPVDNGDGTSTTTTTTEIMGTGSNENGDVVIKEITRIEMVTTDSSGEQISGSWTETGKEITTSEKTEDVYEITVDLTPALTPSEGTDSTVTGASDAADPVVTPNEDGSVTTVTETPREVEVTVNEVEITKGSNPEASYAPNVEIGLTPIDGTFTGEETHIHESGESKIYYLVKNEDGTTSKKEILYSDLTAEQQSALKAAKPDGYDYLYIGHGEDSYFGADWTLPNDSSLYGTGTSQFQLVDPETGTVFTGYCADVDTGSKAGYWYAIENLEDVEYYKSKEGAEDHIRAIALNGYWGTEGENEDGTPATGSLAKLKETLYAAIESNPDSVGMTKEDVDALTEGQALTATQMAIWKYGNPYSDIDLSSSTVDVGSPDWIYSTSLLKEEGMSNDDIKAAKARIDALAAYLMGLSMTAEEAGTTEIINENKFVDEMHITVGEMVKDHGNNTDDDDTNDAYNVDLTFSLVVTPAANDDLIVKVVNGNGDVIKTARIAGNQQEGETFDQVTADANGNYTLTGLELIEGSNATFNLKLEGAQYLEQGVYIYTSEVRDYVNKNGNVNEDVSSQTFVGIAEGYKSVDVSMNVDLTFHVEEGTVTTEVTWEDSGDWDPGNQDDDTDDDTDHDQEDDDEETPVPLDGDQEIPEETIVLENLTDEEVPLADVPVTGDYSTQLLALAILTFAAFFALGRRKEHA